MTRRKQGGGQRSLGLGELEFAVMDHIWDREEPMTVPEVREHLSARRDIAYTTVMTVMARLHEKGLLHRTEDRRPYSYWPTSSREDHFADLVLEALEELDDPRAALARFVERIGEEDAELLRALARKARDRRR